MKNDYWQLILKIKKKKKNSNYSGACIPCFLPYFWLQIRGFSLSLSIQYVSCICSLVCRCLLISRFKFRLVALLTIIWLSRSTTNPFLLTAFLALFSHSRFFDSKLWCNFIFNTNLNIEVYNMKKQQNNNDSVNIYWKGGKWFLRPDEVL